jgi:hypothetical protein
MGGVIFSSRQPKIGFHLSFIVASQFLVDLVWPNAV